MNRRNASSGHKRRKRRLKKSIKLLIAMLVAVLAVCSYILYHKFRDVEPKQMEGNVIEADVDEEDLTDEGAQIAKYSILDVGAGEAVFIKVGKTEVLIDTGDESHADVVTKCLEENVDDGLDYLILSSQNEGRVGGATAVYEKVNVKRTIVGELSDATLKKIWIAARKNGAGPLVSGEDMSLEIGKSGVLDICKPTVASKDVADKSLMTVFAYGNYVFITESDAGEEERAKLLSLCSSCDVIVMAKQGACQDNPIYEKLSPAYIIASTEKNSGHPSKDVIDSIERLSGRMYLTYKTGTIKFEANGSSLESNLDG